MVRKKKSPAETEATTRPEAAAPGTRKPRKTKALAGAGTAGGTPVRRETDVNAGLPGSRAATQLEKKAQTTAVELLKPAVSEHEQIALLAYSFWEARGRRGGSPEEDWYRAEQEFRRQRQSDFDE